MAWRRGCLSGSITLAADRLNSSIERLTAEHLLANRGYGSNAIIDQAMTQGMSVVIPPKKNRKVQREYDKDSVQDIPSC